MPIIHQRTFRVRSYECDAYGHVNHANYLRYMQEAALDASAAVGYDEARYRQMGHIWVIRETQVDYLRSLVFGDSVEVTTWVSDFRRVRSRRMYELRSLGSGEVVAKGSTDWVYIETATGRPARVPDEMVRAFAPEGMPDQTEAREHFPAAPPMPPGAYTMQREVEWRDIDPEQHVNNATYLNYMEECGIQAAKAFGWDSERIRSEGIAIVARQHRIEYREQAKLGERLTIHTYFADLRRVGATRVYRIERERDGSLIAQARSLWIFVNLQTGSIMRLPAVFLEDFRTHIAEGAKNDKN
jgi:acyl-CoA thioester hydrolase